MSANLSVRNIERLCTLNGPPSDPIGVVEGAAVVWEDGRIVWVGPDESAPTARVEIDGAGAVGLPGLVDAHTHLVWAGSRSQEFEARLAGATYSEILEAGGGILSTVAATRAATEDELVELATARLRAALARGVTTVEVKSGYGLEPATEVRMLRAARRAGERAGVRVLTTFLGAHTVPAELRGDRERYVRQVIEEQLPLAAPHADFADVYVDRGAFTVEEGRRILAAAREHGLTPRVHAEQVERTGAAAMAAALGATSADHLERLDDAGVAAMAAAGTVAVLLPGAMLYLHDPPPPVAALREAGVPLAVATDLNPGSSPVADLWVCATLSCLTMGLTVPEALRGVTAAGGLALGRPDLGVVRPGARDLVLVPPPPGEPAHEASLIQHLGGHRARLVVVDGEVRLA